MDFGERLKWLRERSGLTQKFAAEKIGVKNNTLSSYESSKRQPDYITLKKLADLYEVTIDYIITGEENSSTVSVAGQEISLTPDEIKIFEELKRHPILFHDLATDPEKKVKELIKLQKMKKLFLDEGEEISGNGFGDIED